MIDYTHLNDAERDQLASLRARGLGVRASAREMGRSPSTISRELRRNTSAKACYRPDLAARRYRRRRRRSAILERDAALRDYVIARLSEGWSPEQISGRLAQRIEKGLDPVCHETIYAFIYRSRQKAEKLWRYLVRRRANRRPLGAKVSRDGIKNKVHVSERCDAADKRAETGHWEADLVICKHAKPLLVLHERKTRLTLMARLLGKTAGETVAKMQAILKRLTPSMRGSVTFDNGTKFAQHALLRGMLKHTTYFCDAYTFAAAYANFAHGPCSMAEGWRRECQWPNTKMVAQTDQSG